MISWKILPIIIIKMDDWLVVWLPFLAFSHILGISSSQLTFIFFRGVAQPPTRWCWIRLLTWRLGNLHEDFLSQWYAWCFSGWWFGTSILFSHILGIIIPIDFHIFQRGSNHQPDDVESGYSHDDSETSIQRFLESVICMVFFWLVVWNINFIFPYLGNNHPNWLSYFSEGFKPPTRWCWIRLLTWRLGNLHTEISWVNDMHGVFLFLQKNIHDLGNRWSGFLTNGHFFFCDRHVTFIYLTFQKYVKIFMGCKWVAIKIAGWWL